MRKDDTSQIEQFIADLESALNSHDAVEYNRHFDKDISWGNPNGGLLRGLEPLHEVHKSFLEGALHDSRFCYAVERIEQIAPDAAYAHVRLTRTSADGKAVESDERCLYVFARKQSKWWLCAGHNTRVQSLPG